MPLQPWMELISVDDHLIEHPKVWSDRLPTKYLEAGPKIIEWERPDNHQMCQVWEYEGRIYPYIGLNAVAGKKPEEYGIEPVRYDDMIPGCYDPKARVADMDIDGVQAMTCFPSFPRFAGAVFAEGEDKELAKLCSAAWNDFHLDEWAATAPDRFVPVAMLPFWDLEASIKEIHRVAAKGAKCVTFPDLPDKLGLPSLHSDHWDPLFAAFEETDLVLAQHFGSGGFPPPIASDAPFAVFITHDGHDLDDRADRLAVLTAAAQAPEVEDRLERGRHRLDSLHPGTLRQRVAQAPLLPEHQSGSAAQRSVQEALSRLLHRGRLRGRGSPSHRHRQHHLGMRLPAFGLVLAAEPGAGGPGVRERARRRGPSDGRTQHPKALQLPAGGVIGVGGDMDRIEQLPQSDWTDQDLLTKDEARERLVEEIGRTNARLAEVQAGGRDPADADPEVTLLERRLNAMESVRDEYNDYLDGK